MLMPQFLGNAYRVFHFPLVIPRNVGIKFISKVASKKRTFTEDSSLSKKKHKKSQRSEYDDMSAASSCHDASAMLSRVEKILVSLRGILDESHRLYETDNQLTSHPNDVETVNSTRTLLDRASTNAISAVEDCANKLAAAFLDCDSALASWRRRLETLDKEIKEDVFAEDDAVLRPIEAAATETERRKRLDAIGSQWSDHWTVVAMHFPTALGLCNKLKNSPVTEIAHRAESMEQFVHGQEENRRRWKATLLANCVIITHHPRPLVVKKKKGTLRLESFKRDGALGTKIDSGGVFLFDDETDAMVGGDDGDSGDKGGGEKDVSMPKKVNKDGENTVSVNFNGQDDLLQLCDDARTQVKGATVKLYRLEFRFRATDNDAEADEEFFHEVRCVSRPFVILTNTSQFPEGWGAVFWRRFFESKTVAAKWPEFYDCLSEFFFRRVGRGLKSSGEADLWQEKRVRKTLMQGLPSHSDSIDFETLVGNLKFGVLDEYNAKQGGFSRWRYLYSFIDLLLKPFGDAKDGDNALLRMWRDGVLLGFVETDDYFRPWCRGLRPKPNCLLRFSNRQPSRFVFSFKVKVLDKGTKKIAWFHHQFTKRNLKEQKISPAKRILQETVLKRKGETMDGMELTADFEGLLVRLGGDGWPTRASMLQDTLEEYMEVAEKEPKISDDGYIADVPGNRNIWPLIKENLERLRGLSLEEEEEVVEEGIMEGAVGVAQGPVFGITTGVDSCVISSGVTRDNFVLNSTENLRNISSIISSVTSGGESVLLSESVPGTSTALIPVDSVVTSEGSNDFISGNVDTSEDNGGHASVGHLAPIQPTPPIPPTTLYDVLPPNEASLRRLLEEVLMHGDENGAR